MRTTFFLLASGLLASLAVAAPLTTTPNAAAAKLPAESELPNTEEVDDTATKETAKTTSVSPDLLRQAPTDARHKRHARDVRPRTDIDTIIALIEGLIDEASASAGAAAAKRENKEPAHGFVPRDTAETITGAIEPVTDAVDGIVESVTKRGSSSSKGPSSLLEGVSKSGVIADGSAGVVGITNSVGGIATVLGTSAINKRGGGNAPREAAPVELSVACKRDGDNARREAATIDLEMAACS